MLREVGSRVLRPGGPGSVVLQVMPLLSLHIANCFVSETVCMPTVPQFSVHFAPYDRQYFNNNNKKKTKSQSFRTIQSSHLSFQFFFRTFYFIILYASYSPRTRWLGVKHQVISAWYRTLYSVYMDMNPVFIM